MTELLELARQMMAQLPAPALAAALCVASCLGVLPPYALIIVLGILIPVKYALIALGLLVAAELVLWVLARRKKMRAAGELRPSTQG